MNNTQKILLMVFSMSITIFIITGYFYHYIQYSVLPSSTRFEPSIWKYQMNYEDIHTNWLGIIALGNSVASLVGIFLFSEKNYLKRLFSWLKNEANQNIVVPVFMFLCFLILMLINYFLEW